MVEIVFMGTGGAFASEKRTNLSLVILTEDFHMLVEAAPAVMYQLHRAGLKIAEIDALFVSHLHGDHSLGFPMLTLCRIDAPKPLQIYAGIKTASTLQHLWSITFPGLDTHRLNMNWHMLSEDELSTAQIAENITLHTNIVPHPPGLPTLAARWDIADGPSITFVTDSYPSTNAIDLAHGSDLLIHESSFSATLQPGVDAASYCHSTAQQAGELARRAECQNLALIHLGPAVEDHPDVLIEEAQAGNRNMNVLVPQDNERFKL